MGLWPKATLPTRPSKPRSQAKVDCGPQVPGRVCADLLWPENTTQVKFQDHKAQGEIKDDQKKSSETLNLSPAHLEGHNRKRGEAEYKMATAWSFPELLRDTNPHIQQIQMTPNRESKTEIHM